jgi:hypothetical protein
MPLQAAFTLFIIGGAFCTTGALIGGANWLYEGRRRRMVEVDVWTHTASQRDMLIDRMRKESAKEKQRLEGRTE